MQQWYLLLRVQIRPTCDTKFASRNCDIFWLAIERFMSHIHIEKEIVLGISLLTSATLFPSKCILSLVFLPISLIV
ncbi:hypothetical protein LINGRAHAP2_LOCUS12936 [Linum grandiflorum]